MGLKECMHSVLFSYETPKVVEINSRSIGLLHKLLLLSLAGTIIVWVFILHNGYQYFDERARTSTTTKIKGVAYSNSTDVRVGKRIWDAADLYSHPVGDGSFFITTNIVNTHNQTLGTCPEAPDVVDANCVDDSDCQPIGNPFHLGHGTSTGVCNLHTNTCEVEAWCPLENDSINGNLAVLKYTKDFTVFIKNHVYFPHYGKARSNLIESIDSDYLKSCKYHPVHHPYCPIFRMGDIVSFGMSNLNDQSDLVSIADSHFEEMAVKGAVLSITVIWDCNLDYSEKDCNPKYEFSRLDNYGGNEIAQGYNFRYAHSHMRESGENTRELYKSYGILCLVKTEAVARAFHLRTFIINLGSSVALLGIAPIVADFFLLYVHKKRKLFMENKCQSNTALQVLVRTTSRAQGDRAKAEPLFTV